MATSQDNDRVFDYVIVGAGTARAFPIDVSKRDDVLRSVAGLVSEFGRLDIVANTH